MKKILKILPLFAFSALALASCNGFPSTSGGEIASGGQVGPVGPVGPGEQSGPTSGDGAVSSNSEPSAAVISSLTTEISSPDTSDLKVATSDGSYEVDGEAIKITSYGTYVLTGSWNGYISIDLEETEADEDVTLELNGVTLYCASQSPIYCLSANKLKIKSVSGTVNKIEDARPLKTEDDDAQGGGAVYSKCDTDFAGKGTLSITATYNNGIHVTKDVEIKNTILSVYCPNNAIKGNDSIEVQSGTITAISTAGDGLKTEDTDISSKGNQRGDILISGGTLTIYTACDGISAAHDAIITNDGESSPTITIKTNKYSSYTDGSASTSSSKLYFRTSTSYNASYRYAACWNVNGTEKWTDFSYLKSISSGGGWGGGRSTYYYYETSKPTGATSFQLARFSSATSTNSKDAAQAISSSNSLSSDKDCATFSISTSGMSLTGWVTYDQMSQQGGGQGGPGGQGGMGGSTGNTAKASDSAKGIKAYNRVAIEGGTIDIQAYDDGLHATYGETLANGSTGVGDVEISGGVTTIYASDDGVHADRYLKVSGGKTSVTYSYEGYEGNQIYISGGESYVIASDDGVNASAGQNDGTPRPNLSVIIDVSGGLLDVAVSPSGDTDGIDSNGSYKQSGGVVIAKGPNSTNMAALDTDGSVTLTGGTLAVFGKIADTPSYSGVTKTSFSSSYSAGDYKIAYPSATYTTNLPNSYTNFVSYSSLGSCTVSK